MEHFSFFPEVVYLAPLLEISCWVPNMAIGQVKNHLFASEIQATRRGSLYFFVLFRKASIRPTCGFKFNRKGCVPFVSKRKKKNQGPSDADAFAPDTSRLGFGACFSPQRASPRRSAPKGGPASLDPPRAFCWRDRKRRGRRGRRGQRRGRRSARGRGGVFFWVVHMGRGAKNQAGGGKAQVLVPMFFHLPGFDFGTGFLEPKPRLEQGMACPAQIIFLV